MGRLKNYPRVTLAPGDSLEVVADHEDGMVHEELKKCNCRNDAGRENNGRRFLTDKEIKDLVETYVKDEEIIQMTYDEISKRRKDKDFNYTLIKQGVSMTIVSRFCEMGIARPSAMKLSMGVVNILYDLYVADCSMKKESESALEKKTVAEYVAQKESAKIVEVTPEDAGELSKDALEQTEEPVALKEARKVIVSAKSITLENAVIEAGKIKSLMEMMDSYYYDYLSADASEKMQSFYCVFDILKKRYEEFEDGLQHVIYG